MGSERYVELIQRDLDGELSDRERSLLQELLERDEAARRAQGRLREVDNILRHAERVEPPADLRQNVMAQIRAASSVRIRPRRGAIWSYVESALRYMQTRPVYGVGLGFALGLLVAAPLALYQGGGQIQPGDASGTLVSDAGSAWMSQWIDFSAIGVTGSVRAEMVGGEMDVSIRIESAGMVGVGLIVPTDPAELREFISVYAPVAYLVNEGGTLRFGHSGRGEYRILIAGVLDPESIRLVIQEGDQALIDLGFRSSDR